MPPPLGRMDPHLRGVRPSRVDERKEVQSGQRDRGGLLCPPQAGVLPWT